VSSDSRTKAQKILSDQTLDPADRMTESLGSLYPEYSSALSAADQGSVEAAIGQLKPITERDDLFLAADASFYLGRTLMNDERFEAALPLLDRLANELSDVSLHRDVVSYYIGIAQAGLLKNKEAAGTLSEFLEQYPNAPERLRVSAWRKVQELEAIEAGKLDDVYQRMDYSRRRLEHIKTDEQTQEQQDKIVKLLSQLIKQEEKKEASSSSKSNTRKQQKNQQNQQAKNKPKQGSSSNSSKAGSSSNPNGTVVDKSYNDAPASPWSRLRDRSRDPANNAVKDKLPARYRDIVEKYYEAANGNSGSSE
jgi:TolA-binding protein